jgi:hypothetical protein
MSVSQTPSGTATTRLSPIEPAPPRRLLDAALAATVGDRQAEEELRLAVGEHTRALRAAGFPPERVLVLMKTAMMHAGLAHAANEQERSLLASVITWCIGEYYRPG